MKLIISETINDSSELVAQKIISLVNSTKNPLLGLVTGGTVVPLYANLVKNYEQGKVSFSEIRTVNLDEYVGLDQKDHQSFAFFMNQHLFNKTNFNSSNIFLVDGTGQINSELERFDNFLTNNIIDLQLLGIGTNGHIGFNEPSSTFILPPHLVSLAQETINSNSHFFSEGEVMPTQAITMGIRDIMRAREVVLLAFGKAKANVIHRLFTETCVDPNLPCSILKLRDQVTIYIDRELATETGIEDCLSFTK